MAKMLKAAAGKVNITPEEVTPLEGYDPEEFIADPATDILDDLYAKVIVLDDGDVRSVIVSVDCGMANEDWSRVPDPSGERNRYRECVNMFEPGTRKWWAEAAGIAEHALTINCTHTHSAPVHFGVKYTERVRRLIGRLVHELQPVTVEIGLGECSIAANRRPFLRPNLSIPIDRSLYVMMLKSSDGEPVAALVNCAVHPTMIWNRANRISCEMVGLAMNHMEDHFGNGFTALFLQGFSGDICPVRGGHSEGGTEDTYPLVQQAGHQLFGDILSALEHRKPLNPFPFETAYHTMHLPVLDWYFRPSEPVSVTGIRLGEAVILSVDAEVFNDYVGKIADRSPFTYHLCSGMANGYAGYLPTIEAFDDGLGGYEMNTTPFVREAEFVFLNGIEEHLQKLNM